MSNYITVGNSCAAIRRHVVADMQKHPPKTIMDLGCGSGKYGQTIRQYFPPHTMLYGVDGYFPYLESDLPRRMYNILVKADVFDFVKGHIKIPVDCVLCMDVIEHFERERAIELSDWLLGQPLAYISTPLFWFEQDGSWGNEMEKHKCFFQEKEILEMGWKPLSKVHWDARGFVGAFVNRNGEA